MKPISLTDADLERMIARNLARAQTEHENFLALHPDDDEKFKRDNFIVAMTGHKTAS